MRSLVLALLVSNFTFASYSNMSWNEIFQSDDLIARGPQINFNGSFINVVNVCKADAETLRTKNKVDIYQWTDASDEDQSLVATDFLYTSMNYKKTLVDGDDTMEVERRYADQYDVTIYDTDYDFDFGEEGEKKTYVIPNCN